MDTCFRVNQQLQVNLMSALLHYFDISMLSPRKDMPPEDINLGIPPLLCTILIPTNLFFSIFIKPTQNILRFIA
jgi:hypothetical protein